MNTNQISNIITSDSFGKNDFYGVLSRDQFISLLKDDKTVRTAPLLRCVVNLDESNSKGSHWVVAEVNNTKKECYYFDSYGFIPVFADMFYALLNVSGQFQYNATPLQSIDTIVCGHYCILYCLLRARGYSFNDVIKILQHNSLTEYQRDYGIFLLISTNYSEYLSNLNANIFDISIFM